MTLRPGLRFHKVEGEIKRLRARPRVPAPTARTCIPGRTLHGALGTAPRTAQDRPAASGTGDASGTWSSQPGSARGRKSFTGSPGKRNFTTYFITTWLVSYTTNSSSWSPRKWVEKPRQHPRPQRQKSVCSGTQTWIWTAGAREGHGRLTHAPRSLWARWPSLGRRGRCRSRAAPPSGRGPSCARPRTCPGPHRTRPGACCHRCPRSAST